MRQLLQNYRSAVYRKDIEELLKHLRMKPADFEAKFLRIDEDNDKVLQKFTLFFLNEDNTCSIYKVRPKACREYPHTDRKKIYQINNLMLKNTVICPNCIYVLNRK